MNAPTAEHPARTASSAEHGHVVSLLLTDADDGLHKVLTVLRSRRWRVRSLQVDLSGEVGRVELVVTRDGRDAGLLLEQLRRVVPVVRAELG
ncbi:ACT domain-containing protein [Pseudonocardia sp. ICBG1293]|uniref:ACT domain-containing protein n=1 Tax=Pseudonocardia sp. ICBG1293 TaxID=2844382 RepID=UPI001CCFF56A|nr:ACT domain-containing protein [Pseudonocardia sp. ICBG1293]